MHAKARDACLCLARQELRTLQLTEPQGWTHITLASPAAPGGVRAYLVQLVVLGNHQNGRDTHVRQVKIYGPRRWACDAPARAARGGLRRRWRAVTRSAPRRDMLQATRHGELTSVAFSQYAMVR